MKKLILIACILILAGCAELKATHDILDIFYEDPAPMAVCDKDTAGTTWQGFTCIKITTGKYQWAKP